MKSSKTPKKKTQIKVKEKLTLKAIRESLEYGVIPARGKVPKGLMFSPHPRPGSTFVEIDHKLAVDAFDYIHRKIQFHMILDDAAFSPVDKLMFMLFRYHAMSKGFAA